MNDFAVFILTHGRPDKMYTYDTLLKNGYTGSVYIIIDNEDKKADQYYKKFGDKVIMFDKKEIAKTFDEFDNFEDRRAIIYARNASFNIAKNLQIKYFLQLDDDYTGFRYKLLLDKPVNAECRRLDDLFRITLDYFKSISAVSIAFAQGGDFIGGIDNGISAFRFSKRKAMNSFFCSTERKFNFIGRVNEDVNTYIGFQSTGNLFLTIQNIAINQKATQSNKGGMSEMYIESGTYLKSFYTIIGSPSSVKITMMQTTNRRLHHSINWDCAVPQIISEKYKLSCEKVAE